MGGFTAIGSPDVLGLVSGAKPVQTIWSDTSVRQTGGSTGTITVVEKIIPAGTIGKGGAVHFYFGGVGSMSIGLTLTFNWDGNDVISLTFPSTGSSPFYMDIVLTHSLTSDTAQVAMARCGNNSQPVVLSALGAFADISRDIPARFNVTQVSTQDSIQLAFAYAALLNANGPV